MAGFPRDLGISHGRTVNRFSSCPLSADVMAVVGGHREGRWKSLEEGQMLEDEWMYNEKLPRWQGYG